MSRFLERSLSRQQASPTEEFCERYLDQIFEKAENGATIEVRFRSEWSTAHYAKAGNSVLQTDATNALNADSSTQHEDSVAGNDGSGQQGHDGSATHISVIDLDPSKLQMLIHVSSHHAKSTNMS
jgi:hypothetical protein